MADKKISELDQVLQINNDAVFPMSQNSGGTPTTYKASITQIGAEVGEDQTFSNLQTSSKNLVGAINEIAQGGGGGGSSNANIAPDYDATSTYAVGDWCIYNGTLYQCTTAITVAEAFDPTHWTAKKVVDAFDDIDTALSGKVDTTDFLATTLPIASGSATNTKDYIDTGLSGKADISTPTQNLSCPRCPISSFDNYKIQRIGNIIHFSVQLTFGNTSESGYAYFTSALVDSADFVMGSFFDDIDDVGYSIYKGLGTSLWIKNSNVGIAGADLKNKTRMFLNLIIYKAT